MKKRIITTILILIFILLPLAEASAILRVSDSPKSKSLPEEIKDLLYGAYQWPKGKYYLSEGQYIGSFSVFPRENMKVPDNMSIQVIGPEKTNMVKMELLDVTDNSHPKSKDITLFYYCSDEMIKFDDSQISFKIAVPKKRRFIYPYNPCLENSRTYEIRLYKLGENFQPKQLLLKYRFYTLDDNSQFVP